MPDIRRFMPPIEIGKNMISFLPWIKNNEWILQTMTSSTMLLTRIIPLSNPARKKGR